jgi:hypothetical protein
MRRFVVYTLLPVAALIVFAAVPSAPSDRLLGDLSGSAWAAVNYNSSKSNSGNVAKGTGGGKAGVTSGKRRH